MSLQFSNYPLSTKISNINPKTQNYQSTGSGRDTYIIINNGGQTAIPRITIATDNNTPISPKFYQQSKSGLTPKIQHYRNDGSGRDNYIKMNGGGFINYTNEDRYVDSLRKWKRLPSARGSRDLFQESQTKHSFREQMKSLLARPTQNNLIERLSQPCLPRYVPEQRLSQNLHQSYNKSSYGNDNEYYISRQQQQQQQQQQRSKSNRTNNNVSLLNNHSLSDYYINQNRNIYLKKLSDFKVQEFKNQIKERTVRCHSTAKQVIVQQRRQSRLGREDSQNILHLQHLVLNQNCASDKKQQINRQNQQRSGNSYRFKINAPKKQSDFFVQLINQRFSK